jgi:hypothetical protein
MVKPIFISKDTNKITPKFLEKIMTRKTKYQMVSQLLLPGYAKREEKRPQKAWNEEQLTKKVIFHRKNLR